MATLEVADLIEELKLKKRYQEAEVLCSTTLKDELKEQLPDTKSRKLALLYNERGYLRYKQVKFDEAVEDFNQALHLDSSLSPAFYNRGTVHYRLGQFALAVEDMEKAVTLEPNNKEYHLGLTESLIRLRENQGNDD